MKLVIYRNYGGFHLPLNFIKKYNIKTVYDLFYYENRTDEKLIEWVKENPNDCENLVIVEIPDNTTDYEINEYDGLETVTYVVNGKIHHK